MSVSATTRPPRPGERDGVDYHFLDDEAFDHLVATDALLEWADFGGHRYGTPRATVEARLAEGRTVLLEIEVQGARQIRARFADAVLVFLAPPSEDALRERLEARGSDQAERIAERLELGRAELASADDFDHVVVNDDVEAAASRIASILEAPVS